MFSRNGVGAEVSISIDDEGGEPRQSHVNESVSSTPAAQMDLSASVSLYAANQVFTGTWLRSEC